MPLRVPRPLLGPVDLADDRWFLLFAVLCLAVVGIGVIRLREGTTGRYLQALHMSPTAAASIGISATRSRVVAFALAAGIAGFGGGLMASYLEQANHQASFAYLFGLVWVALVVSAGSRSVQAAVMAGLFFFLVPALLERLFAWPGNVLDTYPEMGEPLATVLGWISPTWAVPVAFILFGFGAITYARHPEGSIEAQTARVVNAIVRRVGRSGADRDAEGPGSPDPGSGNSGRHDGTSPERTGRGSRRKADADTSGSPVAELSDSARRAAAASSADGGATA